MNLRIYLVNISIILFTLCGLNSAIAQKAVVSAELDTNAIEIGDQINLKLSAIIGKSEHIDFPEIKDNLGKGVEIISIFPVDTQKLDNGRIKLNKKILISSFDIETVVIPSLPFKYLSDTLYSDSLVLKVNAVDLDSTEKALIDTTQALQIFDIKEPINTPWTFKEFFQLYGWYIVGLLVLVVIIVLLVIFIKRRAKNKPFIKLPEKPKEPAHIIALRALDNLKSKKLWQSGFEKEYYIELSEIIREYIENRYLISTFELTSHELIGIIEYQNILDKQLFGELNQLLTLSDLAKFAKYKPLPNENDLCLKNAYHFVEQTKEEEKIQNLNENQNSGNIDQVKDKLNDSEK